MKRIGWSVLGALPLIMGLGIADLHAGTARGVVRVSATVLPACPRPGRDTVPAIDLSGGARGKTRPEGMGPRGGVTVLAAAAAVPEASGSGPRVCGAPHRREVTAATDRDSMLVTILY
ncbi:MAG TPA: hypothetical protein VN317_09945 [Candidatus Methanoperedens sp.]|nr:hypothetical protein [Candidatus Methanoperedens sp.]